MKKAMKALGVVVVLMVIGNCFSWVAGSSVLPDSSKSVEQKDIKSAFTAAEEDAVKDEPICSVTLITGDVVIHQLFQTQKPLTKFISGFKMIT